MKLQVTLALLCMAFGFNVVNCINCIQSATDSPAAVTSGTFDCGNAITACIMYKKDNENSYKRGCVSTTDTCQALNLDAKVCAQCNTVDCNKGAFISCHDSNAQNTTAQGSPKLCLSGTCIMYKKGNDYVRGCADDKISCVLLGTAATMCSECSAKQTANCNSGIFDLMCYAYNGPSKTDLGTPTLCKTGTCLRYKDGNNYVRACHAGGKETTDEKNPCSADNCNHAAFNAGSTFSLDVRMAAIALAGSLMIFRSV